MERQKIERLKDQVRCGAVLENSGFAVDLKESTPRAVKYRRGSEIIIVTHEGYGWFDPLGDDKGDVFSLIKYLDHVGFIESLDRAAALIGFQTTEPVRHVTRQHPRIALSKRWAARLPPWPGSRTWRYLHEERSLPPAIIKLAAFLDLLREGPQASMWAAHIDERGVVTGWEERGPEWRGFARGGSKTLFRFGPQAATRLCVTEAAIDAMSLAAVEGMRESTLYLSTGGGWSPQTDAALRLLSARRGAVVVAATDADSQGEAFSERLRTLADAVGCRWQRLRPPAEDWNGVLKDRNFASRSENKARAMPHSRCPRQGKLRLGQSGPDPSAHDAGGREGVSEN